MKKIIVVFLFFIQYGFSQQINTSLTYVVKEPAKKETKTPVLIMLHGYGSNETDLFDLSKSIDDRFLVFSLRAPYPASGGGYSWFGLEFLPKQNFECDYKQAKESRTRILSFISSACASYKVDSTQVFVMGFSQGTIMAYDLACFAPSKIKGVVALSGFMMEDSKLLKTDWTRFAKLKFFIAHGNSDNVIKISDAEKANAFLKSKNVIDVTYNNYEMPHSLSGKELNDIKKWLIKAISPKKEANIKK